VNYYEHHLGDYLRDTAHLSMIEDGAYRRLLDLYYTREAALPVSIKDCCRLVRAHRTDEAEAVKTILAEFFTLTDDGHHHKRCDEEIARMIDKREQARSNANARWNGKRQPCGANADALRTHSEGNALQSPVTNNHKEGASAPVLPPDLDPKAWSDWIEYRASIRKPLKPASHPKAMRALAKFGKGQSAVVDQSIAQGWTGLFDLKPGATTTPKADPYARAI
jgi:uncharacterized protein YdaU (DUF1376 family)